MIYLLFFLVLASVVADKERVLDGAASRMRGHKDDHHIDAEALAGSKADSEAIGKLPMPERIRRLRALARKMDENGDEKISEEELVRWITKSMRSVDEEEAVERMREMDVNGNKKISWSEYIEDSFPHQDEQSLDSDDRKLIAEDRKYFEAADVDKDGELDIEELAAFLQPETHGHMQETVLTITLEERDEDKDGAISLKEYLGELAEQPSNSEWYVSEKQRFEDEFDVNKDGKLTGQEIRAWLIPDNNGVAVQEARHLIAKADKDGDGSLTHDEVADGYELFVESEATKYGEHLDELKHTEL